MTDDTDQGNEAQPAKDGRGGEVYTMEEAARFKGVSYHTVSRAVRRGKLPATRLGRMQLIAADDLRRWRPMRERAPHKYRRREPNPHATPALLDLASGERVELARRLSSLLELIHTAAAERDLPDFLALLCERIAMALDLRRVAIWGVDETRETAHRLATYGPRLSDVPDTLPIADSFLIQRVLDQPQVFVVPSLAEMGVDSPLIRHVTTLFVGPLRIGPRVLGVIFGDCDGEPFDLSPNQLDLAEIVTNQVALALDLAHLRAREAERTRQLAAILENLSEAVSAADAEGRLLVTNAANRELLGHPDALKSLHKPVPELARRIQRFEFDGTPIPYSRSPILRALAGEVLRNVSYRIRRPDGIEVDVSVNAQPVYDGERLLGAVSVARDITEERERDRREADHLARLRRATERSGAVAEVASAVNAGADSDAVLATAITRLTDLLGGDSGAVCLLRGDGVMVGRAECRLGNPPIGEVSFSLIEATTTLLAFARREPVFFTIADATPGERVYFARYGFGATLIAPLIVRDEPVGAAYVNFREPHHRLEADDLVFAAALAAQCAAAVDKARLIEQARAAHHRLVGMADRLPFGVVIVEEATGMVALANATARRLLGVDPAAAHLTADDLPLLDDQGQPPRRGESPLTLPLRTGQDVERHPVSVRGAGGITPLSLSAFALRDPRGATEAVVGLLVPARDEDTLRRVAG